MLSIIQFYVINPVALDHHVIAGTKTSGQVCDCMTYLGYFSGTCLSWRRLPRKIIMVEVEMFDGVSNVGHIDNREAWIILILRPKIGGLRKGIVSHVQKVFSELPMVIKGQDKFFSFVCMKILMRSDKIFMISKSDKIFPDPAPYWMTHR